MAKDIAKAVTHHIKIMYPQAIKACPSTFPTSVEGCVYNEIMSAIEVDEEGAIVARLNERKKFRSKMASAYRKLRKKP
jgi:uncharacterized protein YqgV (UPF0045/DUF77 family)